jgi:hypothetical protein
MLHRFLYSFPLTVIAFLGVTGIASAEFDPTSDELSLITLVVAGGLMAFLLFVYAVIWYFNLNHPGEVEIPDHAHDHRYAGH